MGGEQLLRNPVCPVCREEELTDEENNRRGANKMCFFCAYENNAFMRQYTDPTVELPDPGKFGRPQDAIAKAEDRLMMKRESERRTPTDAKTFAKPGKEAVAGKASNKVESGSTVITVNGADERTSLTFTFPEELSKEARQDVEQILGGVMDGICKVLILGTHFMQTSEILKKLKGML